MMRAGFGTNPFSSERTASMGNVFYIYNAAGELVMEVLNRGEFDVRESRRIAKQVGGVVEEKRR